MTHPRRDLFLERPETAVLSTIDRHGRIHSVPVWYRWDGETARIVTGRDSVKVKNLRRNGRAALCVDRREGRRAYVTMEGPVEIVDPLTKEERFALRANYEGDEAARAAVEQGGHENMVLLVLRPEKWLTYGL
jgi:PPOX class probable F420-dependent enzyme